MKRRYIYSILFGVPGLVLSLLVSVLLTGMAMGVLWLFVFGDNPWPGYVEQALPVVLGLVFLIVWAGIIAAGYAVGKRLEAKPSLHKAHILASAGLTLALILFIVLYQFGVGNLGPKSDSTLCSEYCVQKGYLGGSTPPRNSGDRTCSCLDHAGRESLKIPIESIRQGK